MRGSRDGRTTALAQAVKRQPQQQLNREKAELRKEQRSIRSAAEEEPAERFKRVARAGTRQRMARQRLER